MDFFNNELIVPLFAIFMASFMQSITGFGLAIIATPLLLISYDAKLVVLILLCIGGVSNTVQFIQLHRRVNYKLVGMMIVGTLLGQPVGLFIYNLVSNMTLKLIVSICILLFIILMKCFHWRINENRRNAAVTGFLSGILSTTTSMGGPPLVLYLAYTKLQPAIIRATCICFFMTSNITALIGFYLNDAPLINAASQSVVLLPGLALGLFCGNLIFKYVSQTLFNRLIFIMLFFASLYTIYSILSQM